MLARRPISHPLPLAAVAVLALNDHVLKRVVPSALTGKLSDAAGLFFFPVLIATLVRVVAPRASVRSVALGSSLSTALVFASIKTVPLANAIANRVLGPTVLDRTDLFALPACALAYLFLLRVDRVGKRRALSGLDRIAIAVAGLASMATSAIRRPPCTAEPARTPHITWDATCLRTPGARVKLAANRVEIDLPLQPAASACVFDARALLVDYDSAATHVRLHTADVPTGARVEQELVVHAAFDLPYPTRCANLRVAALLAGSPQLIEVDTPIASCTETP
ncbi:MAG: hypothetical protein ACXVEF_10955 [Polyangiales bacterium]